MVMLQKSLTFPSPKAVFKSLLIGTLATVGINTIFSSEAFAFGVTPVDSVSTSVNTHLYLGTGKSYDTFSVNVSTSLDPSAKLTSFTVSLTPPPPTSTIAPPASTVYVNGLNNPAYGFLPLNVPSGWQLVSTGQLSNDSYCTSKCTGTIYTPTLTFEALSFDTGIAPGSSLSGFSIPYSNGCGIYCGTGSSQLKVIDFVTTSVPEPLTILGSGLALGLGVILKQKRSPK